MTVRDRQHRVLARVSRPRNRLYIARLRLANPICLAAHPDEEAWRWHARFGHQHFDGLERLIRHNMVHGMPLIHHTEQVCDACLVGKQRRAPFPQQANYRAAEPLELVHGDLCCPISPPTQGGKRYFLLLVDDHSRFMWLYLLRSKDEAAEAIQRFKVHAERETGRKLRTFRSDRRGEFNSGEFSLYLADLDVQRHLTAPYTPQQNGVVQRRNQTVVGTGPVHAQRDGSATAVLGRGRDHDCLRAQPCVLQERCGQDSVRSLAWQEALRRLPARVWLCSTRQGHAATPLKARGQEQGHGAARVRTREQGVSTLQPRGQARPRLSRCRV